MKLQPIAGGHLCALVYLKTAVWLQTLDKNCAQHLDAFMQIRNRIRSYHYNFANFRHELQSLQKRNQLSSIVPDGNNHADGPSLPVNFSAGC
jgi:hypothetical protein